MDQYDIGGVVGKGSFGVVVLVTRRSDGAQFVMKRLPIQNVTAKEMEAYQNEIRLLSELEHPGIVGYIESFVDRASMDLCIVMMWCSGGDLSSMIKLQQQSKLKRLTESEIKYNFVQLALALHFMHSSSPAPILHRDLKTSNCFLTGGHVVLGDLGISKVLNGPTDLAQTCIGSPLYMSPELFKNKPYNAKSDIWAMSVHRSGSARRAASRVPCGMKAHMIFPRCRGPFRAGVASCTSSPPSSTLSTPRTSTASRTKSSTASTRRSRRRTRRICETSSRACSG